MALGEYEAMDSATRAYYM